jgi:hypothetical protein
MTSSSPDAEPGAAAGADPDAGAEARERQRRRRAAERLGDLLPTTTSDERPEGWGERGPGSRDDELLRDVPPHHG